LIFRHYITGSSGLSRNIEKKSQRRPRPQGLSTKKGEHANAIWAARLASLTEGRQEAQTTVPG
jgi:hypothetical protein